MKAITEEQVVSCLFGMGFDVIDESLFFVVVEELLDGFEEMRRFQLGSDFSEFFHTYVTSDDGTFKYRSSKLRIKDQYSLFLTNIGDEKQSISLADAFASRYPELMEDVRKIDFQKMMIKKIHRLGQNQIPNDFSTQFCEKEKVIIAKMFGFESSVPEYEIENEDEAKKFVKRSF